jgi:hypothetical protein
MFEPKNIKGSPIKKGKTDKVLFSKPSYISKDDPFKDAAMRMVRGDNDPEAYKKAGHDKPFVPAKVVKEKVKAAYEHVSDAVEIKKNFRSDEGGDVIIGPKNFLTNPCEAGKYYRNTTFNGI